MRPELLAECQQPPLIFFRLYLATFKEINKIYNTENEKKYRNSVPITNDVFSLDFENGIVVSVFYLEVSSSHAPDQVVTRFRGLAASVSEDVDAAGSNSSGSSDNSTRNTTRFTFSPLSFQILYSVGYVHLESQ